MDLLIAATARAHKLTLATLNLRHFGMIDGITVEDWSSPHA
jgi:predicted nucleic acid-binding protein